MPANPKTPRLRDKAYTRSAQHRHCMVRHPETGDFCNGVGVVLAHFRFGGNAGIGLKPPDDESLFLCGKHHDQFDGRTGSLDRSVWLVHNVFLPERKAAYRKWRSEVGRS